jgi:uncharacterized membrane protein
MALQRRVAIVAVGARRRAPLSIVASAANNDETTTTTTTITSTGRTVNYTAIAALAAAGCAETSYLAYAKLAGAAVACPATAAAALTSTTSACTSVLSSPYAVLFGLPLPLFGAAAYGALTVSALVAAYHQSQQKPVPSTAALCASAATGAVGTASSYLMWVLQERLNGLPCAWCYASALLSATLVTLLVTGAFGGSGGGEEAQRRRQGNVRSVGAPALGASLLAALVLMVGADPSVGGIGAAFASRAGETAITSLPYQKPEVTTESPPGAVSLARRLKQAGAEMYGAFWCSHCFDQKEAFGAAAMADFPYVECYPDGWKRGIDVAPACNAAGVKAFPTWRLPDGSTVEGELSLEQLEQSLAKVESGGSAVAGA